MANEADQRVDEIQKAALSAMYKAMQQVANDSAEKYAPKGPTLQLSSGIQALKPYIDNQGNVVGVLISSAKSARGFDYAAKQHNQKLRHVSNFPLLTWYGEGMKGNTREQRYAAGYRLLKDSSPKFATKYLTRALDDNEKLVLSLIESAIRAV